jgi:starch synthase
VKILFVASECAPFAKTGGLADVVAALPKALHDLGHEVRIVLPFYSLISPEKNGITFESSCCVHMGNHEEQWIGVYRGLLDSKVPFWFVDCERYFNRSGIYDDSSGEYGDNAYRFALLSKASLQICKDRSFIPDVLHAHDWPGALAPVFLKTWDRMLSPLSQTATVLTIHNIGYQGVYDPGAFSYIGVGDAYFSPQIFEDHGKINLLKAGIAFADAITTVSPTHASEILEPLGGHGLAPFLSQRRSDLFGILNGVDDEHWHPESDSLIPSPFSISNLEGKSICKRVLQERFKIEANPNLPVFGIVSRFVPQKGMDLLKEALPRALEKMQMQVVILGTGDPSYEAFFRWLPSAYPWRAGSYIGFSNGLSHLIEAGSDFFIMPSLYEPCGLNQMYSMKYGSLPIVRATGGLNDTVENYNEGTGEGTGFKFYLPTADALHNTLGWAVSTWYDRPQHILKLRQQAMAQTFSWKESAQKYLEVYRYAMERHTSAMTV